MEFALDGREINMGGIAKGSGMIHPNMATMLAFIVTDVAIEPALLKETVKEVVDKSFYMITVDGEGASKYIEYEIVNAPSEDYARTMIRKISDSSLVKTAMFGRDPNWGRIISAAGNAGLPYIYEDTDLYLGSEGNPVQVLKKGIPASYDRNHLKKLLRESHLSIKLDLNNGKARAKGWGTDLTTDYVLFNSVYTT